MTHLLLAAALLTVHSSAGAAAPVAPPGAAPAAATAGVPTSPPPPAAAGEKQPDDEYRVGAGDVLEITVLGDNQLSRPSALVQTNGTVTIPILGEVPVASLTVPEIKTKITRLLERDLLVRPQVEVKVRDYQSQFVTVLGEINSPGKKPLRGNTRLLDILIEAGGPTPNSSGEIEISRIDGTFSGGEKTLRVFINRNSAPTAQDAIVFQLPLRHGDLIRMLQKYYFIVQGEVARAGRYVLEPGLTISGAISMAGGRTRWAKGDVKILRKKEGTGEVTPIKVDLKGVEKGKKPDVPIQANDLIVVDRRLF